MTGNVTKSREYIERVKMEVTVKVQFHRKRPRIKKRMRKFHMLRNSLGMTHSKERRMKRNIMMKRLVKLKKRYPQKQQEMT
jgi:uncharacterized protein (DUF1786 family)